MGEFSRDLNIYKGILSSLRMDISRAPLELQLVWLFELSMIKAFLLFVHDNRIHVNPKTCNYRVNERDINKAYDNIYAEVLGRLQAYRDTFVHKGFAQAVALFDSLQLLRPILTQFCSQEVINVRLNWDSRMF